MLMVITPANKLQIILPTCVTLIMSCLVNGIRLMSIESYELWYYCLVTTTNKFGIIVLCSMIQLNYSSLLGLLGIYHEKKKLKKSGK